MSLRPGDGASTGAWPCVRGADTGRSVVVADTPGAAEPRATMTTPRPDHARAPHLGTSDLRAVVMERLGADDDAAAAPADRAVLRRAVARALAAEGVVLAPQAWARLVRDLVDEVAGLGPVEALLRDPLVTDVCCNGPDEVWVDRGGALELADVRFRDDRQLVDVVPVSYTHLTLPTIYSV